MALDFTHFEVLSFDCYGTLIDWETGILGALRPLLAQHGKQVGDEQLLELYGELEEKIEAGPYQRYREVLRAVVHALGKRLGFEATAAEADSLPSSLGAWPPFPDTVAALGRLKSRYQLAIISNTDDDLFAVTAKRLAVPFDFVVTAQQVGSYKPAHGNFLRALGRMAKPKERQLHCAQSLYHDIAPTRALGIANVWVNRRHGKPGTGATHAANAVPDLEVPDLKTLADLAGV
jgi:2-haloacid dehalogenase